MRDLLLLACLVLCVPALAKSTPELRTAKVISQNIGIDNNGAAAMPVGTMLVAVPLRRRTNVVVIETTKADVTLSELGNGKHVIVLPVNGTVQFYRDGEKVIILDSKGKKHKFAIVHIEEMNSGVN